MFSHLPGADVIDVLILIVRLPDSLINAGLKLSLVKLHGQHVIIHLLARLLHTGVVIIEGW